MLLEGLFGRKHDRFVQLARLILRLSLHGEVLYLLQLRQESLARRLNPEVVMRWNDFYRRGYSFEALFDIYGETIEFTFAFTAYHHGGRLGSQGGR